MTAKQATLEILSQLPDDCSMEEVRYRLYVRDKIQEGIDNAERGETTSHEEVKRRLAEWRVRNKGK